jgi:serine/threonine-protein kinase PknK
LPLALELAAARLRAMSLRQVADGLSDCFALLNQGRRGAPPRQQTLAWCVKWSYELCTPVEQQLWARLSVFAGGFDLPAAHYVCGENVRAEEFLNQLSALVDKSILIRVEHDDAVRFRLLETLREYGKTRVADTADNHLLRRRHADWYRRLVEDAETEWFGPHQVEWIHRLTRDMPNIREALQYTLTESPEGTLQMVGSIRHMWMTGAMVPEARHWIDLALAATPAQPSEPRVRALCAAAVVADFQHDFSRAGIRLAEARAHLEMVTDKATHGLVNCADSLTAFMSGEFHHARDCLQDGPPTDAPEMQAMYMCHMGTTLSLLGEVAESVTCFENALAVTESHGETVWRSKVLSGFGLACWLQQEPERADELLRQAVQLAGAIDDRHNGAQCLEVLAWIAGATDDMRRAVVLLAASAAVGRAGGFPVIGFAAGLIFHEECERRAREALGDAVFDVAWRQGSSLSFQDAVDVGAGQTPSEDVTFAEYVPDSV